MKSFYCLIATASILLITLFDNLSAQTLVREIVGPKNLPGTSEEILYDSSAVLMENKKILFLGKGADPFKINLFFVELQSGDFFTYTPSVLDYFDIHKDLLLPGSELNKNRKNSVYYEELLSFDRSLNQAIFLVKNSSYKYTKGAKIFLIKWNIKEDKFIDIQTIYETTSKDTPLVFNKPLGTDSEGNYYFYNFQKLTKSKDSEIKAELFKYASNKIESLYTFQTKVYPSHFLYDRKNQKILILEYAEAYKKLNPQALSYDIASKTGIRFPIPSVPYGKVYSQDGKRIFITSAETGEFKVFDSMSGKVLNTKKLGTYGHAMGYWKDNEIAWIRNSGIHIYDDKSFKQKKVISTRKFFPKGSVNVQGSLADPSFGILLRNSFSDKGEDYRILQP